MVGEINAMDWARTVGKPNAFFRSPGWFPGGAGVRKPVVSMALSFLSSRYETG
jgi:hypothetical protein